MNLIKSDAYVLVLCLTVFYEWLFTGHSVHKALKLTYSLLNYFSPHEQSVYYFVV